MQITRQEQLCVTQLTLSMLHVLTKDTWNCYCLSHQLSILLFLKQMMQYAFFTTTRWHKLPDPKTSKDSVQHTDCKCTRIERVTFSAISIGSSEGCVFACNVHCNTNRSFWKNKTTFAHLRLMPSHSILSCLVHSPLPEPSDGVSMFDSNKMAQTTESKNIRRQCATYNTDFKSTGTEHVTFSSISLGPSEGSIFACNAHCKYRTPQLH